MSMIEDVKSQTVVKHPVTEVDHFQILSRLRSSISDIQKNHRVLINLQLNRGNITNPPIPPSYFDLRFFNTGLFLQH